MSLNPLIYIVTKKCTGQLIMGAYTSEARAIERANKLANAQRKEEEPVIWCHFFVLKCEVNTGLKDNEEIIYSTA